MIVLVSGVHGVGKSRLCSEFSMAHSMSWVHYSASSLIEMEKKNPRLVHTPDTILESNQKYLLSAIENVKKSKKNLLLDGHFALRNSIGLPFLVPKEIFEKIDFSAVFLIEADFELIKERLRLRNQHVDTVEIEELAKIERSQAQIVSEELRLPLTRLFQPTLQEFEREINNLL